MDCGESLEAGQVGYYKRRLCKDSMSWPAHIVWLLGRASENSNASWQQDALYFLRAWSDGTHVFATQRLAATVPT